MTASGLVVRYQGALLTVTLRGFTCKRNGGCRRSGSPPPPQARLTGDKAVNTSPSFLPKCLLLQEKECRRLPGCQACQACPHRPACQACPECLLRQVADDHLAAKNEGYNLGSAAVHSTGRRIDLPSRSPDSPALLLLPPPLAVRPVFLSFCLACQPVPLPGLAAAGPIFSLWIYLIPCP